MDDINDNISLFSVLNLIITSLFNLVIIKLLILQSLYSLLLGLLGNTMYLIKNTSYNWGTQESLSSSDDSAKAHHEDGAMHWRSKVVWSLGTSSSMRWLVLGVVMACHGLRARLRLGVLIIIVIVDAVDGSPHIWLRLGLVASSLSMH